MEDSFKQQGKRKKLVQLLVEKGITDHDVLRAIGTIPRHSFVKYALHERAYDNTALRIDEEQTISQPFTVAFQTQLLEVKTGERILEIGTGSGYQAAVLAELGAKVYTIERIRKLHEQSKRMFRELGYFFIKAKYGDGYEGWPDCAPFDKIIITAAPEKIPAKLKAQLKVGGRMVVPVGRQEESQEMILIERLDEENFKETSQGSFRFVPMKKEKESNSRFRY